VLRLSTSQPDFAQAFNTFVNARREADADVSTIVEATIRDVRARGDVALLELTERFDGFDLSEQGWQITAKECAAAYNALAPE
jgi:histidinol dehydrogenase